MSTIKNIQDNIIENFSVFDEWEDKYGYIIEIGKKLPAFDEKFKTDENLIRGCQSKVWMTSEYKDGKVYYYADSDALIVKGLVALLLETFSGQAPDDILYTEPFFIEKIGMKQHLSMTRSNGLVSMIKQIKFLAFTYNNCL